VGVGVVACMSVGMREHVGVGVGVGAQERRNTCSIDM